MRHALTRKLALATALAALLASSACVQVANAPPGGGEIVHEKFRIGPLTMQPHGQWFDTSTGYQQVPRPSGSFGIKTVSFDIVDTSGNPVPRHDAHLHHIVMGSSAANDSYCPGGERFAGAGAERNPITLPDPYAYLVGADDRWTATWEVVNEADRAQTVYIEYDIGYQRGANAQNSRGVRAFFLDVAGCTAAYNVPGNGGPGSIHTQTRTWTAPWDGYLVTAVGHMHAGGIDLTLRDDELGVSCTMTASYEAAHNEGHENPPHAITRCPVHVRVEQGQRFSVISRYDNSQPYPGAMGIVRAYAWPGNQ